PLARGKARRLERLSSIGVIPLPDDAPVLQAEHHRIGLAYRDAARLPPAHGFADQPELIAQVDQLTRLPAELAPGAQPLIHELHIALVAAVGRLQPAALDELPRRVILHRGVPSDEDGLEVPAVERLSTLPRRTPNHGLSDA